MILVVVVVVAYVGMDGCNIGSGGQISGCGGSNGAVNSSGRNSDDNGGRGQPM